MNKVEAFKNELRNYHYYKAENERLSKIYEIQSSLVGEDNLKERFKLLKEFFKPLIRIEQDLDETFTKLTGFHAIRYDKEPSAMNEELSMEMKLELIDKYNELLTKFQVNMIYAEENLIEMMNRVSRQVNYIESVLNELPNDLKELCVDIYCNGKTYQEITTRGTIYYTDAGLFKIIERELDKIL